MKVYVVWYNAVEREVEGFSEVTRIYSVVDSVEKAREVVRDLEKKFGFYADFDGYEVE